MKTSIKREIAKALEVIAARHSSLDGWLVCYQDFFQNITFSIFKNAANEKKETITIQGIDFFIYEGTEESDILPIAHKIIKEIEEVEL